MRVCEKDSGGSLLAAQCDSGHAVRTGWVAGCADVQPESLAGAEATKSPSHTCMTWDNKAHREPAVAVVKHHLHIGGHDSVTSTLLQGHGNTGRGGEIATVVLNTVCRRLVVCEGGMRCFASCCCSAVLQTVAAPLPPRWWPANTSHAAASCAPPLPLQQRHR